MRSVTNTLASAFVNPGGFLPKYKLSVYKSFLFFKDADVDVSHAPLFAHPVGDTDFPLSEASAYNTQLGKVVTVMVSPLGKMYLAVNGDAPVEVTTTNSVHYRARPGIWENTIYYFDGEWKKATFDTQTLQITSESVFVGPDRDCACYPVSDSEVVFLYISEGAVRPAFISSDGVVHKGAGRFFSPTRVMLTDNDSDVFSLHSGGAVKHNGYVRIYYTMSTGAVNGVGFKLTQDELNGTWTDFYQSIPSDLSKTDVVNVFEHNGRVFMSASFSRNEEFASGVLYTIFTYSDDGVTFAIDRRVLVSLVNMRFSAILDGGNITFCSSNRTYSDLAPYQVVGESARHTILYAKSISGNQSKISCDIKAGDESYLDIEDIRAGAYAKLEIGAETSAGDEYVKYFDVVVDSVDKGFKDGDRKFGLVIVPDGIWHTQIMSHPFYMEFQGKQHVYDECTSLNNLDNLSDGIGVNWSLTVDFWDGSKAYQGGTHAGGSSEDVYTVDLSSIYDDYPVFGDAANYKMMIYGWSRAGRQDTNPNTPDDTPTDTNNDSFYGIVDIEKLDGRTETLVTPLGNLVSDHANPPQNYFKTRDGSYPVVFNVDNPGAGVKIIRLGVRVVSDTGNTTYNLERIEMPDIVAVVPPVTDIDDTPKTNAKWVLVDTISLQITTGNDVSGDKVTGAYNTKVGYAYAVVIVGDVEFTRGATIQYIQDAEFVASCNVSDERPPTWDRSYPPGTPVAQNSSVQLTVGYNPFTDTSGTQTISDSIPGGVVLRGAHDYLFHADESALLRDSGIQAKHVPYIHGSGSPVGVALYLAGSGEISDIVRGEFYIYVFESPVEYYDFNGVGDEFVYDDQCILQASNGESACGTSLYITGDVQWDDRYNIVNNCVDKTGINVTDRYVTTGYITVTYSTGSYHPAPDGSIQLRIIQKLYKAGIDPAVVLYDETVEFGIGVNSTFSHTFVFDNIVTQEDFLFNALVYDVTVIGSGSSAAVTTISRGYIIAPYSGMPTDPQVPEPPSFEFIVPDIGEITTTPGSISNTTKGTPKILFSSTPYSAWNFEVVGRYRVVGDWSKAGVLGLAEDNKNYIVGYIRTGHAGVGVVRDGVYTELDEKAVPGILGDKTYDVRVWHRDGLIGIEVKRIYDTWGERGSLYTHDWKASDGPIATNEDFFHLGSWSFIDPPKFRTTGYVSGNSILGVMPLDFNPETDQSDFVKSFPSSGSIDICGKKFVYSGKYIQQNPMGPFQLRNGGTSSAPYTSDLSGDYTFASGEKVEILQFNWWEGSTHAGIYSDAVMSSNAGYSWKCRDTQWKVWITTGGQVVYLRHRAKHFVKEKPNYYLSGSEKVWFTSALLSVSGSSDGEAARFPEGSFVYLDHNDEVVLTGFIAVSGKRDNSVQSLLQKLCSISGTSSDFPGDKIIPSSTLQEGEGVEI